MDLKYLLFIGSALGFSLALGVCIIILAYSKTYPVIFRSKKERQFFDPATGVYINFPAISDKRSLNLSVIVPAYNEEERLGPMLDECLDYLESRRKSGAFSYEVIVVSDGSTDQTVSKALSYTKKHSCERVRVLALEKNRGKGGAVRLGMLSARGSLLLFADADGATKFADLRKLEDSLKELVVSDYLSKPEITADTLAITVGSRAHLEDEAVASRTVFRTILMYGFHFLVWLFAVKGIRDTQCGFKLLTRKAAAICFESMHVERWAFDVELLYIAQKLNIPISEVAVNWTEIEGSKVTPVWSWLQMGLDLGLIWLRYTIGAWKIRSKGD
uniref:Dolichyl-phosphate beta-glucosyltransferase n=1 Tax=Dendroctonus ponderosae TaxID=77166 RepID=J3JX27_DENPD|nr:unknown [Dendroctonus ponderosae]